MECFTGKMKEFTGSQVVWLSINLFASEAEKCQAQSEGVNLFA